MKPISILSLCSAWCDLSEQVFNDYLDIYDIKIKAEELNDLDSLVNELKEENDDHEIYDNFFVGFSIGQIGKEFDLLRIGENCIVNIELKREDTGVRIVEQLKKNRYYLSFLKKDIWNFTYVHEDNKLYMLNESDDLCVSSVQELVDVLSNQRIEPIENIDSLFNPTNYLVSPFNSTDAFLNGNYFLTDHQEQIKKNVMPSKKRTVSNFVSIYGAAGTGKTLLTYDIAKSYIREGKNVVIFHCGNLNNGHYKLRKAAFGTIEPIKEVNRYIDNNTLTDYDLVIFDEVQRVYPAQIRSAIGIIKQSGTKCIFSYDSQQCLANKEIIRNIPELLDAEASPAKFKLTEKIRTNKEIAAFIKNLFDLSKQNHSQKYSNVEISYFSNSEDLKKALVLLESQGWETINYTPSQYNREPFDNYTIYGSESAHQVIGQEFDKVVAVVDKHFYYNNAGKLSYRSSTHYNATKMLFQIVTRTRKKLHIIIMDNEEMLKNCIAILNRSELETN